MGAAFNPYLAYVYKDAQIVKDVAQTCVNKFPHCSAVTMWGLTDENNYIKNATWLNQDQDWPFIFDENFNQKLNYKALLEAFG